MTAQAPLDIRELTPELWPAFEKLFGANGACAGCWCMWWRLGEGEKFMKIHGAEAKRRQKALVFAGQSRGLLAFSGGDPVGWCAYGRRTEFAVLGRSRTLACDDAEQVWSVPCFFIKAGWRGRGVGRALLRAAIRSVRHQGGRVAEGYPVRPPATNSTAFTGTVPWFESEGFRILTNRPRGRQRARLML
ncbi:MAG TPA: GNAT family N-acetyltransferase [Myxococcales bacterium]|jgi:GNAT superfamily N-acetyltransferase|nr:GNAT family N-acetyltransferase [Myxococcales bacterium]